MLGVLLYLMLINGLTFGAFAFDKAAAESGKLRVPERRLLFLALIGGSLGALIGQQVMRHKTKKQPFRSLLFAIGVVHVLAGATLIASRFGVLHLVN